MDDTKLTPLDVARRNRERNELRRGQQKEMDFKRMEQPQRDWNQTLSASADHYMTDALKKVREKNHITHHENITRLNGTWMHNQSRIKH